MSDLTPDDDALLEQARSGLSPTADDHDRVRRRVLARVAVGVGAAGTTLTASGVAGGMTAATVVKIVGAVLVAGGVVGATMLRREKGSEKAVEHSSIVVAAGSSRATREAIGGPASALAPPPPAAAPVPVEVPAAPAVTSVVAPPPPIASSMHVAGAAIPSLRSTPVEAEPQAPRPVDPPGPATVADEARLLREADAARSAGNPGQALALLEEHGRRFPGGVLVEERSAERVVVLCALGRTREARAAGEAFLRDHPASPLTARVRASCAAP